MGLLGLAAADFVGLGGFESGPFGVSEPDLYFSELTSWLLMSGERLLDFWEMGARQSKIKKLTKIITQNCRLFGVWMQTSTHVLTFNLH